MSGSFPVGTNYLSFTAGDAGPAGTGAFTIVVLAQPASGNNNAGFVGLYASGTLVRAVFEDALKLYGPNDFSSGFGTLTQNTWYVIAITKSAASAPWRMHYWPYSAAGTGAFTHGVSTGAANQGNGAAITEIRVGVSAVASNGLEAAVGVWNVELQDSDFDNFFRTNLLDSWRRSPSGSPAELISLQNWNGTSGAQTLIGSSTFSATTGTVSAGANPPSFDFSIAVDVTPTGVGSGSAVGQPAVAPGPVDVTPTGVGSGGAVGQPAVAPGPVDVTPAGVASSSAFGQPVLTVDQTVTLAGLGSVSDVGAPLVAAPIFATGVDSASVVGSPAISAVSVTVSPAGVASASAVGQPALVGLAAVFLSAVPSTSDFGFPALLEGEPVLALAGVASGSAIGRPAVFRQAGPGGQVIAANHRVSMTVPSATARMTTPS